MNSGKEPPFTGLDVDMVARYFEGFVQWEISFLQEYNVEFDVFYCGNEV